MSFKLVFIDDSFTSGTSYPFVRAIGKRIPEAELFVFTDPDQGLSFILDNLDSQLIAFIDCDFSGYGNKGIVLLKEIRKTTSLLYIVMMSAYNLRQIEGLDIAAMINEDFIWFYDKNNGSVDDACSLIQRITKYWSSRFDCVLERWLVRYPEDKAKIVYSRNRKAYSWEQLLKEVRLQTEVGKDFARIMNQYCISKFKLEE